jgi:hypothetical protein
MQKSLSLDIRLVMRRPFPYDIVLIDLCILHVRRQMTALGEMTIRIHCIECTYFVFLAVCLRSVVTDQMGKIGEKIK